MINWKHEELVSRWEVVSGAMKEVSEWLVISREDRETLLKRDIRNAEKDYTSSVTRMKLSGY